MTGRELIVYILENGLENEEVFDDGKFIGYLSEAEAAEIVGVGSATIRALVLEDKMEGVQIGNKIFIPADFMKTWRYENDKTTDLERKGSDNKKKNSLISYRGYRDLRRYRRR